MAYSEISRTDITAGKPTHASRWTKVKDNFDNHETRIGALETSVQELPIGTILAHGGTVAPTGYLFCDGQAVSRSTYSGLFTVLSTSYGVGDGTTTFNVPDMKGRSPIGSGTGDYSGTNTARSLGDELGTETHTITEAEMDQHTHTVTEPNGGSGHRHVITIRYANPGATYYPEANGYFTAPNKYAKSTTITTGVTIAATGSGSAHENMSPYLVCAFIIKVT